MNLWMHELRLVLRSRLCVAALLLVALLASVAVASGLREVERQRGQITRLGPLLQQDLQAVERKIARSASAGYAAYYSFHPTHDAPSDLAFLALGLRDVSPAVLRVRALGLQAQIHEGETFNPELALAGRFDFAFVLIYLAPLFLVALLHDLVSGERQTGRLGLLLSMPGAGARLWWRRAVLRAALVFAALALPLFAGGLWSHSVGPALATALAVVAAYLLFWTGLCLLVAARPWSAGAHATAAMGLWLALTLVLPTLAQLWLARSVPVAQGVELMLKQRENVHAAWDQPREPTLQAFFRTHPEWKDTAPLPATRFHWKWYYAFQQLGDESVADEAAAYREGLLERQRRTERLGAWLPGVGAQAALHRLATTDLPAQLRYQDRIAAFHARLRAFYYPYVFNDRPFRAADFAAQPRFDGAVNERVATPWALLVPLFAMAGLAVVLGATALRRVRP